MMKRHTFAFGLLAAALIACAPNPPTPEPVDVTPVEPSSGLVERRPDTCKAEDHRLLLNQPVTDVQSQFPTDRPVRILVPGGIYSEEYDPRRIVFRTNAEGIIIGINCG